MKKDKLELAKKVIKYFLIFLALFFILLGFRYCKENESEGTPTSRNGGQGATQVAQTPTNCLMTTIKYSNGNRFQTPPMRGWWETNADGSIHVVQEPFEFQNKVFSKNSPIGWSEGVSVFQFTFDPQTGKGRWSQTVTNGTGEIDCTKESPTCWRIVRSNEQGEAAEVFLLEFT